MLQSIERARYEQKIKQLERLLSKSVWITLDQLTEIVSEKPTKTSRSLLDRLRCHELTEEKTFEQRKRLLMNYLDKLCVMDLPTKWDPDKAPDPEETVGPGLLPVVWQKSQRRRYFHVVRIQEALEQLLNR